MGALSLLAIWRIVWSRKRYVFTVFAAFVALAILMSVRGEDEYTAEVLLVLEANNADLTDALSRDGAAYEDTRAAVQIFGSRRVFQSVVDDLDLTANPMFNPFIGADPIELPEDSGFTAEALIEQTAVTLLESKVEFQVTPSNRLIRVTATTTDPDLSAQLANTVAAAFLADLLNTRLQAVDGVVEQLGQRVVDLRQQVREKEQNLQQFINSVDFTDPEVMEARRASATQLRDQMERIQEEQVQTSALLSDLEALSALEETAIPAAFQDNRDLARLASGFGTLPNAAGVATLRIELEQQRQSADGRLASLAQRLEELESQIADQSVDMLRYQQLERELEASAEIYDFSVRRLNELSVQSGVESGGGRIVMPADVPLFPDSRGLARNVFFLGLLGLFSAIAWVLIRETTNHTLQYAEDVGQILPQVPQVSVPANAKRGLFGSDTNYLKQLLASKPSLYTDAVQRLRTTLMLQHDPQTPLVVNIASDLNSTGKAKLTLALASSFAALDKRVLVIDANTHRSGVIADIINRSRPEHSLQSMIAGISPVEDTVHKHTELGVDFLLSGPAPKGMGDHTLVADALPYVVDNFRNSYDVILVDTVPLLGCVNSALEAEHVNAILFVVSLNESSRQSLADTFKQHPHIRGRFSVVAVYGGKDSQHRQYSEYNRKLARL